MKTHTINFQTLMTQNIQLAAYDIYGVTRKKPAMSTREKQTMILKNHPQNHLIHRLEARNNSATTTH